MMSLNNHYTISFVIKRAKDSQKPAPIVCRITVAGKRTEIPLKRSVDPKKWDPKIGKCKGQTAEALMANKQIDFMASEILRHHQQLVMKGQRITAKTLKDSYLGILDKKYTLIEAFEYHNSRMLTVVNIDVELGTYKKFETVLAKIKRFLKHHFKQDDIFLDDLKHSFAVDFEYFMKTEDKVNHNTALRYIRCLKKVILMAISNEWIVKNPFINYECQYTKVEREILTTDELER